MEYKIIGIGNPLMGDDAFGLFVVEELKKLNLPANIMLYSLPTPSPWQIYEVFLGEGEFIIVDVFDKGVDGVIEVFPISELSNKNSQFRTVHDININQVLDLLKLQGKEVEGLIVGTKGENFSVSLSLSKKLQKMLDPCVNEILKIIE